MWICSKCEHQNSDNQNQCVICGITKPSTVSQEQQCSSTPKVKWYQRPWFYITLVLVSVSTGILGYHFAQQSKGVQPGDLLNSQTTLEVEEALIETASPNPTRLPTTDPKLFSYTIDNGSATITGFSGNDETVVIPKQIDGYNIVAIGNEAFLNNNNISEVIVLAAVTRIGDRAFGWCGSLNNINLPDTVEYIGDYAFSTTALTSFTVPQNVSFIGNDVFFQCGLIERFHVSESNISFCVVNEALMDIDQIRFIRYAPASKNSSYDMPDSIRQIDDSAFENSSYLVSIDISANTEAIGEKAFSGCYALKSIKLPNTLSEIGWVVFENCIGLSEISVDNSSDFFEAIDGVLISKKDHELVKYPANKQGEEYIIPDGVLSIASDAFSYNNETLANLTIPKTVTLIQWGGIGGRKLRNVIVLNPNITIEDYGINNDSSELVITCNNGSTAQKYAQKNNIDYVID